MLLTCTTKEERLLMYFSNISDDVEIKTQQAREMKKKNLIRGEIRPIVIVWGVKSR
jgi:hypothetical protein